MMLILRQLILSGACIWGQLPGEWPLFLIMRIII
jgi:hypothetical protein